VTLEVAGRKICRITSFPLGMANVDGLWYLVPMRRSSCERVAADFEAPVSRYAQLATSAIGRRGVVALAGAP
jgi:hypothetical protein